LFHLYSLINNNKKPAKSGLSKILNLCNSLFVRNKILAIFLRNDNFNIQSEFSFQKILGIKDGFIKRFELSFSFLVSFEAY
tara:strand:+ start:189 stop:431 length:243 start_codon:yes stop_codon:yes gene_type:complete